MPDFPRLILVAPLATEQIQATTYLMDREGLCVCGRFLKRTDAKFCLGQINTSLFPDPRGKNTLLIAAYCFACFGIINDTLKAIKGKFATPEPDRQRHEGMN